MAVSLEEFTAMEQELNQAVKSRVAYHGHVTRCINSVNKLIYSEEVDSEKLLADVQKLREASDKCIEQSKVVVELSRVLGYTELGERELNTCVDIEATVKELAQKAQKLISGLVEQQQRELQESRYARFLEMVRSSKTSTPKQVQQVQPDAENAEDAVPSLQNSIRSSFAGNENTDAVTDPKEMTLSTTNVGGSIKRFESLDQVRRELGDFISRGENPVEDDKASICSNTSNVSQNSLEAAAEKKREEELRLSKMEARRETLEASQLQRRKELELAFEREKIELDVAINEAKRSAESMARHANYMSKYQGLGDMFPSSGSNQPQQSLGKVSSVQADPSVVQASSVHSRKQVSFPDPECRSSEGKYGDEVDRVASPAARQPMSGILAGSVQSMHQGCNPTQTHSYMDDLRSVAEVLQLPKTEMVKFNGDPLKFRQFMRCFDDTIDCARISASAKLSHLIANCEGKARQLVESTTLIVPSEAGYLRARTLLKARFGNDFSIVHSLVARMRNRNKVADKDKKSLRDFSDSVSSDYEMLRALEHEREFSSFDLLNLAQKLPEPLQNKWRGKVYQIRQRRGRSPDLGDFVSFVKEMAEVANDPVFGLAQNSSTHSTFKRSYQVGSEEAETQESLFVDKEKKKSCILCQKEHWLGNCDKFFKMTVPERQNYVMKERLCRICFNKGHVAYNCRSKYSCTECKGRHSKLLHMKSAPKKAETHKLEVESEPEVEKEVQEVQSNHVMKKASKITLPIIPVRVQLYNDDSNRVVYTNALLDSGSTQSFCTMELLEALNSTGIEKEISLRTLSGTSKCKVQQVDLEVSDIDNSKSIHLPKVCSKEGMHIRHEIIPQTALDTWQHLRDIPFVQKELSVGLLIGQDCPEALVPLEIAKGCGSEPYATRTSLGWAVNGPLGLLPGSNKSQCNFLQEMTLEQQVERFWTIENPEVTSKLEHSVQDRKALSIWENSLTRTVDGHFSLSIPFKRAKPNLANNVSVAVERLGSLKRRLSKDDELKAMYKKGINELIEKGYSEVVPEVELERDDGKVWYLPHHPVFHPQKPGKCRIVFDCSAKFRGTCLNDNILQGPDLTNNLLGVLIRFRQGPVALMGDIEAMFHQVRVTPEDKDVLRFLWWPDGDFSKSVQTYRMTVHLFGGIWSPSVCNFALRKTAELNAKQFEEDITKTVRHNFYVDDCLKSLKTVQEGVDFVSELSELLALGGFKIAKWVSNSRDILKSIPDDLRAKNLETIDLDSEALPLERALGVSWNIEKDSFIFKISEKDKPLTRRGILSVVSSVYDPLGLASPFVLPAKMILQEICRQSVSWDEKLPEKQLSQWLKWKEDLKQLEGFSISRGYLPKCMNSEDIVYQIHHFCDASEKAYGVISYLRMEDANRTVACSLVLSKSRLAPIKSVTIPRLELMAATQAAKLDAIIREELDFEIGKSYFWTDSTIVLHYINSEQGRFQTFVANRVRKIHEQSDPHQWKYIGTSENPADIVSRGLSVQEFLSLERWSKGPEFLELAEGEWPKQPEETLYKSIDEKDLEIKKVKSSYSVDEPSEITPTEGLLRKFSQWSKTRSSVAWLLRFFKYLGDKKNVVKGPLVVQELKTAELAVFRFLQQQEFRKEYRLLSETDNGQLKNLDGTSSIKDLNPIFCKDQLLHVGGRLKNAKCSLEVKYPIIIPRNHPVTRSIIWETHIDQGHPGVEHVLSLIREKFWIVRGRQLVKQICSSCFKCRKRQAPLLCQKMADLPEDRVELEKPPFSNVGVDYFGPILVKRARSHVKRYGCLFTCLVTRAIHLEMANSLDTDSFILALSRFVARRGKPSIIRSDNGTNFRGAERELRDEIQSWNQSKISSHLARKGISWLFNPPSASHMGGVWERQIRTVRKVMSAVCKEQVLDDEGLRTLFCEVEAIVNSRPLTKVSEDPNDNEALTPNHLLLFRTRPDVGIGENDLTENYPRRRWRQIKYLASLFWKRWLKEYLVSLQVRSKWSKERKNLKVGDVVLVLCENVVRGNWPTAVITQLYPGSDKIVRSVKLKTKDSELVRPIHKLCLLEEA